MSINNAERKQDQFNAIIGILIDGYKPRIDKYIDLKDKFLKNVKKNYQGREKTIEGFKTKIFRINMNEEERFWNEEDKIKKEEEINRIRNRNGLIDYKRLATLIDAKE